MIYTTEQDEYPKIPHEIIIDYFNNFMKNPESSLQDTESIDLEKELSIRNMPISVFIWRKIKNEYSAISSNYVIKKFLESGSFHSLKFYHL